MLAFSNKKKGFYLVQEAENIDCHAVFELNFHKVCKAFDECFFNLNKLMHEGNLIRIKT